MVEKKKEEFTDLLQGLGGLAQSYAHMSPNQLQALAQGATISQGTAGSIEIQGKNVVVNGDSVALSADAATFLISHVKIDSLYENNPVMLSLTYQSLPQGPSYPAQVDLQYPSKKVQVLVENSNYQRLQAALAPAFASRSEVPPDHECEGRDDRVTPETIAPLCAAVSRVWPLTGAHR